MMGRTKILAIVTAMIVVLAAFVSLYYTGVIPNQSSGSNTTTNTLTLPSGQPSQWQIKVTGDFSQEKSWTLDEISQMPLTEAIVRSENATYLGVTLVQFCNQTGVGWDAGPLIVIGQSGQSAPLNMFEAWNSTYYPYGYNYNVMILAFVKNGQWMTNDPDGPVKLVTPTFPSDYQVGKVTEIHTEPWAVSISGNVAHPLAISGTNLTDFQSQTIHAEFRPGGEPNRTSDWTGIPILDALQSAGVSEQAEQITIVGIDGYQQNYTLQQVSDGKMMIGYQENGKPLPLSQGGPFRLFAPTDQYKWGQYWVKFIHEIKVS